MDEISGMLPNVQLMSEPWGHYIHEDRECECQSSDRTAAYVHELSVDRRGSVDLPDIDMAPSILPESDWNKRSPALIPFVSCRPGAYGRLWLCMNDA